MKLLKYSWILFAAVALGGSACSDDNPPLLPADLGLWPADAAPDRTLIARLVHISDTHVVDTLSPARWAGAHSIHQSAWRPHEALSTQILDGIVRAANRIHASGDLVDLVVHTGDACDNAQANEFGWILDVFDGRMVNSLSGPDDRPPEDRPPPLLDPYAPFEPQGLYRAGVHGDLASIPWYMLVGNHDNYAIGIFPIIEERDGSRVAPIPLSGRPGWLLPTVFDPVSSLAWGNVTPADPGPPRLLQPPSAVTPNPERAYVRKPEIIERLFATTTHPPGHGFAAPDGPSWYSVSPVPGLRLIGLDTADHQGPVECFIYATGSVSAAQADFLRAELETARARGEVVIVATHHPSQQLGILHSTALDPDGFRALLNSYPDVVALHLCGHVHRNRVALRGSYVEIETCGTLDSPQEARLVELWRDTADGTVVVSYRTFSHLDESRPPLGTDPLRALRQQARDLAEGDVDKTARQQRFDPSGAEPAGTLADRHGEIRLPHSSAAHAP